jgi:Spy/CpxP family protein refolding chaperone
MGKLEGIFWIGTIIGLATWSPHAAQAAPAGVGQQGVKTMLMSIPGLNADQKNRITHLTNTAKMQTAPLHEQIAAARKNLARLWSADELDKSAIASKHAELDGAMAKVRAIWDDFFVQLHDVLTTQQRSWLAARAPGLHGSDAGAQLGVSPKGCLCGETPAAQHP